VVQLDMEAISLTRLESDSEMEKQQQKFEEQLRAVGRIIEQEEMKGVGKKRFYERIFFESNALNIGDFLLRNMIVYYRNLFLNYYQ